MAKLLIKKQEKESFKRIEQKDISKLLTTTKTMLLTKKQEQELFKRVADGDKKAISKLVSANLFLVDSASDS